MHYPDILLRRYYKLPKRIIICNCLHTDGTLNQGLYRSISQRREGECHSVSPESRVTDIIDPFFVVLQSEKISGVIGSHRNIDSRKRRPR